MWKVGKKCCDVLYFHITRMNTELLLYEYSSDEPLIDVCGFLLLLYEYIRNKLSLLFKKKYLEKNGNFSEKRKY